MNSVSLHTLVLEIRGGPRMRVDLKRHLSPRTVEAIVRSLPITGNAHFMGKSMVYVKTRASSGVERARAEFKRGDVAFYPADGSICFFVGDARTKRQMSVIGRMVDGIDGLMIAKSGDVLVLYQDGGTSDDGGGGGGGGAAVDGADDLGGGADVGLDCAESD